MTNKDEKLKATAYLHTITYETGEIHERVSLSKDNPWGKPGIDYSAKYGVKCQPLYLRPVAPLGEGEAMKVVARAYKKDFDKAVANMLNKEFAKIDLNVENKPKSQWRPISEAPRDGTAVLVWEGKRMTTASYDIHYKAWEICVPSEGYRDSDEVSPLMWMPLPSPPSSDFNLTKGEK